MEEVEAHKNPPVLTPKNQLVVLFTGGIVNRTRARSEGVGNEDVLPSPSSSPESRPLTFLGGNQNKS